MAAETQTTKRRSTARTATARVMDDKRIRIGSDKETELRGGQHMTLDALADTFMAKDVQTAESRMAVTIIAMIRGSDPKEVDEVLRGATKDERTKDKNAVPPLVAKLMARGMSKESARTRLYQVRTVRKAYDDNRLPIFDAKGNFDPSKIPGWNPLVKIAGEASQARKDRNAQAKRTKVYNAKFDELASKAGGVQKLSDDQFRKFREEAQKAVTDWETEQSNKTQSSTATRTAQTILKKGAEYAYAMAEALATALGYKLVEMSAKELQAANVTIKESDVTADVVRH